MDTEIIESVLKEILEEQKASLQVTKELSAGIDKLGGKVDSIQQKLEQQKVATLSADSKLVQSIVSTGIRQIQKTVEAQPKSVVRQFRFLLFPEHFAEQYYRIVLGRLLFWMMVFLLTTYLFVLGRQSIESSRESRINQYNENQFKDAWYYLYKRNKKLRAKMDSVLTKKN